MIVFALLGVAAVWILNLRRQLQTERMRGDMYRDISARLDRRLADIAAQQG